jgi:DNA-binding response OmpR family regulator
LTAKGATLEVIGLCRALSHPFHTTVTLLVHCGTTNSPDMSAKILVIDDEEGFINLIACYLRDTGYEIIGAREGIAGLQQARRHSPDIIFVDLGLPDVDGFLACKILRKQASTLVQIVLVTALASEIAQDDTLASGADHFLTKPFSREDLTNCVEKALQARKVQIEDEAGVAVK